MLPARHSERRLPSGHVHPTLAQERLLRQGGRTSIAGVDEVGRGALAGPVAAAAVVLPQRPLDWFGDILDSKELSPASRETLAERILTDAAVGLAMVPAARIDSDGIVPATRRAMSEAIRTLGPGVDAVLIDAVTIPGLRIHQTPLIHGDQLSLSIACAAICAKVTRDRLMSQMHEQYPQYGFDRNKGYGTEDHRAALARHGPAPVHRMTFLSRIELGPGVVALTPAERHQ